MCIALKRHQTTVNHSGFKGHVSADIFSKGQSITQRFILFVIIAVQMYRIQHNALAANNLRIHIIKKYGQFFIKSHIITLSLFGKH